MGTTLNRHAYQRLIDEDLEWLLKQPYTLERMHIEAIVRASPDHEYTRSAALPVEGELLPEIVTALMDTRNALQLLVSGIRTVPQNEPLEARIPVQLQAGDIKHARDVLLANADLAYRALASADLARSAPVVPQPAAEKVERKYLHTGRAHPETVVDWFLNLSRHWFTTETNLFYGQHDAARQYLDSWIKTGEFAPDRTTLEIHVRYKFEEWLESSWTLAAVPVSPAAEKWQLIESAPKGIFILMAWPDSHQQIVKLLDDDSFWYESAPTHWMPLPAPPAAVVPQHCNFCGEPKPDLIPATVGFICKDCVGICASMVEKPAAPVLPDDERLESIRNAVTNGYPKLFREIQMRADIDYLLSLLPVPEDEEENQNQKVKDA